MSFLDFVVIFLYVASMAGIAWFFRQRANSLGDFFNAGKNSPWWLLGISMVATTFAADTPLAVTGIVAKDGLAGNWIWWSFLFSAMLTTVVFARKWQQSGVLTDVELIQWRYSGKPARVLRGFRAFYLAIPVNCIILGWVTLGMTKILTVLFGAAQWQIIIVLYVITGIYIALTGIWGVLVTDALQFVLAMIASIVFAFLAVEHVGGLAQMKTDLLLLENGAMLLNFIPDSGSAIFSAFLVWIGVTWWASWYPGVEPGGGGYIVQRLVSAKSPSHATGAALFFTVAHFALRPWPWILVAFASLLVYPELSDKETGYPLLMKDILPAGWYGLMLVAFISAFVSTVSTHLNWGASYLINDLYKPFVKPETSFETPTQAEKHYVNVSRISTLVIMAISIVTSYFFDSVKGGWETLLSLGAGIGPVLIFRWFWRRISAWSELSAMIAAAIGTSLLTYFGVSDFGTKMALNTLFSTMVWLTVTFLTAPTQPEILNAFFDKILPNRLSASAQFLQFVAGCGAVLFFLIGMRDVFFFSTFVGMMYVVAGTALAYVSIRFVQERG